MCNFQNLLETSIVLSVLREMFFSIELQDHKKSLNFLNYIVTNTNNVKYQFNVHHKDLITNIHTKLTRGTSPKIFYNSHALYNKYINQEKQFLKCIYQQC